MLQPSETHASTPDPHQLLRQVVVRIPIYLALMAVVLLLSAGRVDWWLAWLYVGLTACVMLPTAILLTRTSPGLVVERMTRKKDAKGWDKIFVTFIAGLGPLVTWIVAGLDQRFGWSPPLTAWPVVIAVVVYAVGHIVSVRAMMANRFFSAVVRIQTDRGHEPITHGPYARVRHPGYVGAGLSYLMVPLLLGSLWAFIPILISLVLLVVRTALEDQTLHAELPGYREYAERVRYRLVPGLW